MRNQTMRVQVVNLNALKERKDVMLRFMRAYRETLDWMYANPQAAKFYGEKMKLSEELVILQRDQFNPKEAMLPDRLSDLDLVMEDAVALKFLDKPMTRDELTELFQIPAAGVVALGRHAPRMRGSSKHRRCDIGWLALTGSPAFAGDDTSVLQRLVHRVQQRVRAFRLRRLDRGPAFRARPSGAGAPPSPRSSAVRCRARRVSLPPAPSRRRGGCRGSPCVRGCRR
jgi:hypothetical protein